MIWLYRVAQAALVLFTVGLFLATSGSIIVGVSILALALVAGFVVLIIYMGENA